VTVARKDTLTQKSAPFTQQHYRELPPAMFAESLPSPSPTPQLLELNHVFLEQLAMSPDWFASPAGLKSLSGNGDYQQQPIAMAYAGHQFGGWVDSLGDGRAHMLGQMRCPGVGVIDVQLKGSGRTPFSRGGDGRATLAAVMREYIVSEAMAALSIPTTRALAIITTGEQVIREEILPGAILVRTASSHLRVGTFQYALTHLEKQGLGALADFTIEKYFSDLSQPPDTYLGLLRRVIELQASLVAQWMLVGFIHGVMNTDNVSIVGETIDYGPCAFMDEFQSNKVFSSIDQTGRYAWDQQPAVAYWNLTQFAQCLLPILHTRVENAESMAQEQLEEFIPLFQNAFQKGLRQKFGLTNDDEASANLIEAGFKIMGASKVDFTVFFDGLTRVAGGEADTLVTEAFENAPAAVDWLARWHHLKSDELDITTSMRQANPAVIPRNHRVAQAINAAVNDHNYEPFRRLHRVLANPYQLNKLDDEFRNPPEHEELVTQTFCGT